MYPGLKQRHVHLPLIDLDLSPDLQKEEALGAIKSEIKKLDIGSGVILGSGGLNHFHFLGTERLLTEEQLITFLGFCLNMRDPQGRLMVDPKWVGHALTPLNFLRIEDSFGSKSIFDLPVTRYGSLRITTSEEKPFLPYVIGTI